MFFNRIISFHFSLQCFVNDKQSHGPEFLLSKLSLIVNVSVVKQFYEDHLDKLIQMKEKPPKRQCVQSDRLDTPKT